MMYIKRSVFVLLIFPPAPQKEKQAPELSKVVLMSDFIRGSAVVFTDVVNQIYEEINNLYGTDVQVPSVGQDND